jgi:hypothetical protein
LRTAEPLSLWVNFVVERKSQFIGLDSILFDYFLLKNIYFKSCFILLSYPCGFFALSVLFFAFYLGSSLFTKNLGLKGRDSSLTPVESFRKGSKDSDSKNPGN